MNYKYVYDCLIEKARKRTNLIGYKEKHHIIPLCCGGNNTNDNLVYLTAKEHYVAHHLLMLIHKGDEFYSKLICAFRYMTIGSKYNNRLNSAKDYSYMRKLYSENHPCKNKETKNKISESLKNFFANWSIEDKQNKYGWYKQKEYKSKTKQRLDKIEKFYNELNNVENFYILKIYNKWKKDNITELEDYLYKPFYCFCCFIDFWKELESFERKIYIDNQILLEQEFEQYKLTQNKNLSKIKQSFSMKKHIDGLTNEEQNERLKKSLWSCNQIERGKLISQSKKGKKTNQLSIMGNRFADMTDEEFASYLQTKSVYVHTRYTNLRNRFINERNRNNNSVN